MQLWDYLLSGCVATQLNILLISTQLHAASAVYYYYGLGLVDGASIINS